MQAAEGAAQTKQEAVQAQQNVVQAKQEAVQAKLEAVQAKQEAVQAKQEAIQAKQEAVQAKQDAEQARQAAATLKEEYERRKLNAAALESASSAESGLGLGQTIGVAVGCSLVVVLLVALGCSLATLPRTSRHTLRPDRSQGACPPAGSAGHVSAAARTVGTTRSPPLSQLVVVSSVHVRS